MQYGCGQCMPCRINRRREWTGRMLLEAQQHAVSWFVTLTYDEANLPVDGTLVPEHLRDWLKRLRWHSPEKIRFYAVGEYGERSWRPHYHVILFGGPLDVSLISKTWRYGLCHLGFVTQTSLAYCAGYVEKKLTSFKDERLNGRYPEFSRMSRRPGIGVAVAVESIGLWLTTTGGVQWLIRGGGKPLNVIRHEKKLYPLGRTIQRHLKAECGIAVEPKDGFRRHLRSEQRPASMWEVQQRRIMDVPEYRKEAQRKREHSELVAIRRHINSKLKRKV